MRVSYIALLVAGLGTHVALAAEPPAVTFEQHVRPILKAHCFQCHGEAGEKEAGLDLRLRRWIAAGGDSGPAFVAGAVDESLIIQRIRSGEMPPGDDKQLSPEQLAVMERWVAAGAPTARPEPETVGEGPLFTEEERSYWAFQMLQRPAVPVAAHGADQVRTPIDAFVLERLEQEAEAAGAPATAYRMSADADRTTLIRRLYFDLIGLPPAPEEVDAFVSDPAPDAFERLIERLLASPHYGERWGRHWLDVAGYADSEGYTDEDTVRKEAFRYRDYVIRAFNRDKPFDDFLVEQLAGDELVPLPHTNLTAESIEKLTATGFLRMAPDGTGSGGVEQPVARNQVVADTLQIVGTTLLGMTVHCAQCHDHRYDPIPQVDYYRLRAIFEPALSPEQWRPPLARRLSLYTDADRQQAQAIEQEAVAVDQERSVKIDEFIKRTLEEQLADVPAEAHDSLRAAYQTAAAQRTAEQQTLLKQYPTIDNISPGSLYLYDGIRLQRAAKLDAERSEKAKQLVSAAAEQQLAAAPAEQREALRAAAQAPVEQRTAEQQALLNQFPGVLVTAETLAQFDPTGAAELEANKRLADELRAFQAADVLKQYADRAAEIRGRKPPEHFLRVLNEVPGALPATRVFYRGDIQQPKDEVTPADLSIVAAATHAAFADSTLPADDPNLPTSGRRLAFAQRLTGGEHPLTARVLVNRLWLHHFGRGIVNSPGDFGVLGERPTHPELLDWLASEFVASGWSVKHMHRLIMTSSVYRQQSLRRAELDTFDPDNHFYGRMALRRMESETVRDSLLAVSGRLNHAMFGTPVPVMEDEVGQIVIGRENLDGERKPVDQGGLGGDEFRRSIYVQVRRSRPLAMLETFDAPLMDPHCTRRSESTVALQSLMLMNNRAVVEEASKIAERLAAEVGSDRDARIERAWRLTLARRPTESEQESAARFLMQQEEAFQSQQPDAPPADTARQALASLCQALISSSAFLYID